MLHYAAGIFGCSWLYHAYHFNRRAIRNAGLEPPQLADAFTEAGEGVRGVIDGRRVAAGRQEWVADVIGCSTAAAQDDSHAASTATVVYVGMEGRGIIGSLAFKDSLR
jgi:cation transport ATPase